MCFQSKRTKIKKKKTFYLFEHQQYHVEHLVFFLVQKNKHKNKLGCFDPKLSLHR